MKPHLRPILKYFLPIALALVGVTNPSWFSDDLRATLFHPVTLPLSQLLGSWLILAMILLFFHEERVLRLSALSDERERKLAGESGGEIEALKQKLLVKQQEVDALDLQLRDRERLRLIDITTGIPNQLKWDKDIETLSKLKEAPPQSQMIIIDLDNFREINQRYSYEKGDAVIRCFARSVFNTMRRDEEIYKNLMRDQNDEPVPLEERWQRIYRKYTGGDEFIFIIAGTQAEAVGFLVRIARDLLPKINREISEIVNHPLQLAFHAGMTAWIRG